MDNTGGLPKDYFHAHVYVFLDATECMGCGLRPDLLWAWDGVAHGEAGASQYAVRAVSWLKQEGWRMDEECLLCPACAERSDCNP